MDFFRFPHTPHLAWLAEGEPRGDKVLGLSEANALLSADVVVEEKLDGANLGISLDANGDLQLQNRGQYLEQPYKGQFSRLNSWLGAHRYTLKELLRPSLILFGEWCAARHSLSYDVLPDWFLVFDVYDRREGLFWDSVRRNDFVKKLGLRTVHEVKRGLLNLNDLKLLVSETESYYHKGKMEGVVVRNEKDGFVKARAKLVRADFTQSIEDHWRTRTLEWNQLKDFGS